MSPQCKFCGHAREKDEHNCRQCAAPLPERTAETLGGVEVWEDPGFSPADALKDVEPVTYNPRGSNEAGCSIGLLASLIFPVLVAFLVYRDIEPTQMNPVITLLPNTPEWIEFERIIAGVIVGIVVLTFELLMAMTLNSTGPTSSSDETLD